MERWDNVGGWRIKPMGEESLLQMLREISLLKNESANKLRFGADWYAAYKLKLAMAEAARDARKYT